MPSTQLSGLKCPDCGNVFQGDVLDVTCSMGHPPVHLHWWDVCRCGHDAHYDMTMMCLTEGCECEEWNPDGPNRRRQITRRPI